MGLGQILSGKIGSFGNSAAQFAKNISVDGMMEGWNTYIRRSPEELAEVAKTTMHKKNNILDYVDFNKIDNYYASAVNNTPELKNDFNKYKNAIKNGNLQEAETIAKRFNDDKYLKFLQDAEGEYNAKKTKINGYDADDVHLLTVERTKQKLQKTPIVNHFIDDGEWLAEKAYKLNPKGIPAYFTTDDSKTNRIRAGVVGAGYMGGSMVVRGLQGGNPVTNEYGERDIAGIPFI